MDLIELQNKVIPLLKEKLFPDVLIGELVYYYNDNGIRTRVNKDKSPSDIDYVPNKVINVVPNDNLNEVKKYFALSNFSKDQIAFIFDKLDKEFIKFKETNPESFVSFSSKFDYSEIEQELKNKIDELIECYESFKIVQMSPFGLSFDELLKEQNTLTTNLSIEDVYNHFKVLTETTNKHNKFYLTNQQLLVFIHSTFVIGKPKKQEFSRPFVKKEIRKIFYNFYQKNASKDFYEKNLKRKYFKILDDSFGGFNESDYIDFHK